VPHFSPFAGAAIQRPGAPVDERDGSRLPERSRMSNLHQDFVDVVKQLEPLPPTVARLASLLSGPDWSMHEVEECVAFDQALTTKLLRIANSALWFRSHAIGSVRDAVMRIGSGTVVALVMGAGVQRRMAKPLPQYGLREGDLWKHSVASALAASVLD